MFQPMPTRTATSLSPQAAPLSIKIEQSFLFSRSHRREERNLNFNRKMVEACWKQKNLLPPFFYYICFSVILRFRILFFRPSSWMLVVSKSTLIYSFINEHKYWTTTFCVLWICMHLGQITNQRHIYEICCDSQKSKR